MPRGGYRPRAGRPKGALGPAALDKLAAREYVRKRVTERLAALVDAQIDNALGLKYLVTRDRESGKFIRVGPAMASQSNEETIEVWEKDPNVPAFTDLMNRALDKPAQQPIEVDIRSEQVAGAALNKWKERNRRLRLQRQASGSSSEQLGRVNGSGNGHGPEPVG
jgi:hypothetical protein